MMASNVSLIFLSVVSSLAMSSTTHRRRRQRRVVERVVVERVVVDDAIAATDVNVDVVVTQVGNGSPQ